ncbi:MAG: helix-turn-helix transcriptional regulator [Winogradskyella sp.]|nr:helix-turn-helix transcriptional regulator [Winogradskyella sp.]
MVGLLASTCYGQFSFSGYIDSEEWQNEVYLSIIEDYRKLSGVYSEQIISKTLADNDGFFEFTGNMLDDENRIYRIHVDNCTVTNKDINHFNGYCNDSEEVVFIANNTDTLKLPFSFGKQVFCTIESNNPKSEAFIEIDSLMQEMRFAYSEVRSEANRKLNNKLWFSKLQNFGESLKEPLAELYIYAFLSDRSSELHSHYVEDLKSSDYYDKLESRLTEQYPNTTYTQQYISELTADRYLLQASESSGIGQNVFLYTLLILSILLNAFLLFRYWKRKQTNTKNLKAKLSRQERVVLDEILQDKTNKDIAETLFLSVSTIKTHTNNIFKKLNIQSREDAKDLFS